MRYFCYPSIVVHPYQKAFINALEPWGIHIEPMREFSNAHLRRMAPHIDGINLHFIHNMWTGRTAITSLKHVIGFIRFLRAASQLGLHVVWNVHDLVRHGGAMRFDRCGFNAVARYADLVIVHSNYARRMLEAKYRVRGQIIRMAHGNFSDVHKVHESAAQVRRKYGLDPVQPIVGVIGNIHPYRGHDVAIETAKLLQDTQLFIAGTVRDEDYFRRITQQSVSSSKVKIRAGRLDDNEYASAVAACDVILLPYREITGSGALLSAWTMGVPVVMRPLEFFQEFVPNDPAAGMIATSHCPYSYAEAIKRILSLPKKQRSLAARIVAERYDWKNVVEGVAMAICNYHQSRACPKSPF